MDERLPEEVAGHYIGVASEERAMQRREDFCSFLGFRRAQRPR